MFPVVAERHHEVLKVELWWARLHFVGLVWLNLFELEAAANRAGQAYLDESAAPPQLQELSERNWKKAVGQIAAQNFVDPLIDELKELGKPQETRVAERLKVKMQVVRSDVSLTATFAPAFG